MKRNPTAANFRNSRYASDISPEAVQLAMRHAQKCRGFEKLLDFPDLSFQ